MRAHWSRHSRGLHPALLSWGRRRRSPEDAARAGTRAWDEPRPESLLRGAHGSPRAHGPAPPAPAPRAGCPIYQATYVPAPDGMADPFLPQDSLFTKILTCLREEDTSPLLTSSVSPHSKADRRWSAHFPPAIIYRASVTGWARDAGHPMETSILIFISQMGRPRLGKAVTCPHHAVSKR